jgi:hypothetical protein
MLVMITTPRPTPAIDARVALREGARVAAPTWQSVLRRYQQFGGLAGGDEVASRLRGAVEQPISTLARWIVAREVLVLPCDSVLLLPLFQFDFRLGRVSPGVVAVLTELRSAFDDWDLASWFSTANVLLDGAAPMQGLEHHTAAVLKAARTDRFIAAG